MIGEKEEVGRKKGVIFYSGDEYRK